MLLMSIIDIHETTYESSGVNCTGSVTNCGSKLEGSLSLSIRGL